MNPWSAPRKILLILLFGLPLTACGNVPRPFEPTEGAVIFLPESPSTLGIGVLPIGGIDADAAEQLAGAIADALRQQDIPAEAVDRAGRLGYSLEGHANIEGSSNLGDEITMTWHLKDRNGDIAQQFTQALQMERSEWKTLSQAQQSQVADDLTSQVARSLAPTGPVVHPPALLGTGLSVVIRPPAEAPGDGAIALARILGNRLAQQGFKPAADESDFQIVGSVIVRPYDSAHDDIAIVWQVLDSEDKDLGEVRLDNRIPRGDLDGPWGLVAEAIIDSAFPGLMEIVSAAGRTRNQ
tara:strand:- start:1828 stop:2715 length:888 start_codon:yes stop_codon:yes gene_type:complete